MTISLQELQLFFFLFFKQIFLVPSQKPGEEKKLSIFLFFRTQRKPNFIDASKIVQPSKPPKQENQKIFFCFKISCPVITRFKNHRNLHTLPSNFFFCLIFFFWMEEIQEKERKKIFNQVVVPGSNIPPKVFGIFVSFTSNFF